MFFRLVTSVGHGKKSFFISWQSSKLTISFILITNTTPSTLLILAVCRPRLSSNRSPIRMRVHNWAYYINCNIQVKSKPTVINALNNRKARYYFFVRQQVTKRKYHSSWCLSRCLHRTLRWLIKQKKMLLQSNGLSLYEVLSCFTADHPYFGLFLISHFVFRDVVIPFAATSLKTKASLGYGNLTHRKF